jgi:uncharacterized membrane protein
MTILLYLITVITNILIDAMWLGLIAKNLYQTHLGFLFAKNFSLLPGIIFYLLYGVGILVFAVFPALAGGGIIKAVGLGMLLGLMSYGAYDLTNLATIKNWPLMITIIDLAWGVLLSGAVAGISFMAAKRLL